MQSLEHHKQTKNGPSERLHLLVLLGARIRGRCCVLNMELRGQNLRCRRFLAFVAAFLAMSGSMLGSEPEKRLQARWSELKQLVEGKKVTLQLAAGAQLDGQVRKVTDTSLVFKVKKSSDQANYPKGKIELPRETVSRIEVRGLKENKGRRVLATVGTAAGAWIGSMAALIGTTASESEPSKLQLSASVAIATAAAVLVYRALAPKGVTFIEILPDSPGEGEPKRTNKDQSSTPTTLGEALAASLVEESRAERLRRQARRAVMRHDLPLDLSSLPVHPHRSGID